MFNELCERIYFKTALSSAPLLNFAFAVHALGTNSVEKIITKSIWATHNAACLAQMILQSLANGFCIKQKWSINEHSQPHLLLQHEANCIPIQQTSGFYCTNCIKLSYLCNHVNFPDQCTGSTRIHNVHSPCLINICEYFCGILELIFFDIAGHKTATFIASQNV